jgi:hypothetical protein
MLGFRAMSVRSIVSKMLVLLVLCVPGSLLTGCGGSGSGGKTANVKSESMPDGGSWTGVYYSPLYGWLHLVEDGNNVNGKWLRPRRDRWGKLQGSVDGNVLRFTWEEFEYGLVGPNSTKSGKGYLVYKRPPGTNVDDQVEGELGRGLDEVGQPWDGVKQRNVKPDLESIGGASASDVGGGDWDKGNKEQGEPEEPKEPSEGSSEPKAPELP